MVRKRKGSKKEVDYYEFRDGFKLVDDGEIEAVIALYSAGKWKKNELRVYAGMKEHESLHKSSKVDLYRIVNSETAKKGIKRLSHREIDAALATVTSTLPAAETGQKKPLARRFLRYIAKGSASCSETILLLYYCHQRIRQPKKYDRLAKAERFARFTYRELALLSGMRRATLCDGLKRLVNRGLLNTVAVAKQNENVYGMLFIDGATVSLTRKGPDNRPSRCRWKETVTPSRKKRNAPRTETATLINNDPKTRITTCSNRDSRERIRNGLLNARNSQSSSIREAAERALMDIDRSQTQAA